LYRTISFKTDSWLLVTSPKFGSHMQRMLFPPFPTSIPRNVKGHLCLHRENQMSKQMKLWFVIAFLVILKDFCQQVPPAREL